MCFWPSASGLVALVKSWGHKVDGSCALLSHQHQKMRFFFYKTWEVSCDLFVFFVSLDDIYREGNALTGGRGPTWALSYLPRSPCPRHGTCVPIPSLHLPLATDVWLSCQFIIVFVCLSLCVCLCVGQCKRTISLGRQVTTSTGWDICVDPKKKTLI